MPSSSDRTAAERRREEERAAPAETEKYHEVAAPFEAQVISTSNTTVLK